jgi:hypothetical protein
MLPQVAPSVSLSVVGAKGGRFGDPFATGSAIDPTVISPRVAALATGVLKRILFAKLATASVALLRSRS